MKNQNRKKKEKRERERRGGEGEPQPIICLRLKQFVIRFNRCDAQANWSISEKRERPRNQAEKGIIAGKQTVYEWLETAELPRNSL